MALRSSRIAPDPCPLPVRNACDAGSYSQSNHRARVHACLHGTILDTIDASLLHPLTAPTSPNELKPEDLRVALGAFGIVLHLWRSALDR